MTIQHTTGVENISMISRIVRASLGALLIGFTMTTSATPLGVLTLLPLFSIYLVFTAITGWDALRALFHHEQPGSVQFNRLVRLGSALVSGAMIATVFLGYVSVLPLVAIYPMFIAITGHDPLDVLYNQGNVQEDVQHDEFAWTSHEKAANEPYIHDEREHAA